MALRQNDADAHARADTGSGEEGVGSGLRSALLGHEILQDEGVLGALGRADGHILNELACERGMSNVLWLGFRMCCTDMESTHTCTPLGTSECFSTAAR
jgi:hypothetical protein